MGWDDLMKKYPLIALAFIGLASVGSFVNTWGNQTATQALEKRISQLEWKVTSLQDTVNSLEIPPRWFEQRVHDLEEWAKEIDREIREHNKRGSPHE